MGRRFFLILWSIFLALAGKAQLDWAQTVNWKEHLLLVIKIIQIFHIPVEFKNGILILKLNFYINNTLFTWLKILWNPGHTWVLWELVWIFSQINVKWKKEQKFFILWQFLSSFVNKRSPSAYSYIWVQYKTIWNTSP